MKETSVATRLRIEPLDGQEAVVIGDKDSLEALLRAAGATLSKSSAGYTVVNVSLGGKRLDRVRNLPKNSISPAAAWIVRNWLTIFQAILILAAIAAVGLVVFTIYLAVVWLLANLASIGMILAVLLVASILLGGGGCVTQVTVRHWH